MSHPSDFPSRAVTRPQGSALEVFLAFLKLGLTSFGGPVAHLGYFRDEFVVRRQWLDEQGYSDLVALCQFLPGPASSQVGMAIGLSQAGIRGAVAAWCGFTAPSALLMVALGASLSQWRDAVPEGLVHGFKLLAVVVVAQAVWGMARVFCRDAVTWLLMLAWAAARGVGVGGRRSVARAHGPLCERSRGAERCGQTNSIFRAGAAGLDGPEQGPGA